MHVGLIGGIGPAATEYYYRGLLREGGDVALTIAHARLDLLLRHQRSGEAAVQAEIFAGHIDGLKAAGAEIAAVTSVAGHFCHSELAALSSLPLISILDALNAHFATLGVTRVGLIGSPVAMETRLYGAITAAELLVPPPERLNIVGGAYTDMAERGEPTEAEREICLTAAQDLAERAGAEAVLLGGTDLYMVFEGVATSYPVIDAAEVHITEIDRHLRAERPLSAGS